MKDTDKVTLTLGQIKKLIKESKASKRIVERRLVKETSAGDDVISDLVDRALSIIQDGGEEDSAEAVTQAIDEGLIYTKDIYDLLEHYNTIDNNTIIQSYYEDLFNDVLTKVDNSLDK